MSYDPHSQQPHDPYLSVPYGETKPLMPRQTSGTIPHYPDSTLSNASRPMFCVVCGSFERILSVRKSGLKCDPHCIGKRSKKEYTALQQRYAYFALLAAQKGFEQPTPQTRSPSAQPEHTENGGADPLGIGASHTERSPTPMPGSIEYGVPGEFSEESPPRDLLPPPPIAGIVITPPEQTKQTTESRRPSKTSRRPSIVSRSRAPTTTRPNAATLLQRYPPVPQDGRPGKVIPKEDYVACDFDNISVSVEATETVSYTAEGKSAEKVTVYQFVVWLKNAPTLETPENISSCPLPRAPVGNSSVACSNLSMGNSTYNGNPMGSNMSIYSTTFRTDNSGSPLNETRRGSRASRVSFNLGRTDASATSTVSAASREISEHANRTPLKSPTTSIAPTTPVVQPNSTDKNSTLNNNSSNSPVANSLSLHSSPKGQSLSETPEKKSETVKPERGRSDSIFVVVKNNEEKSGGEQQFSVKGGLSFLDSSDDDDDNDQDDNDNDEESAAFLLTNCGGGDTLKQQEKRDEGRDSPSVLERFESQISSLSTTTASLSSLSMKDRSTGHNEDDDVDDETAETTNVEEKTFIPDPAIEARLREFYAEHNPEKLPDINEILKRWFGREETMFQTLINKYITEPQQKVEAARRKAAEDAAREALNKPICVRWYRFNDCYLLFDVLKAIGRDNLPELPSKTMWRRFTFDFVEDRRKAMERFIQAVFQDPFLIRHPSLTRLLGITPVDRNAELEQERIQRLILAQQQLNTQRELEKAFAEKHAQELKLKEVELQAVDAAAKQAEAARQVREATVALQAEQEKILGLTRAPASNSKLDNIPTEALGSWKKGSLLGKGSYGSVFLGLIPNTSQLLAVKVMMVAKEDNNNHMDQVRNELNLMKNLNHPNLVRCLGSTWDKNTRELCMFQEYIECGSISRMVSKFGALPINVIQAYLHQILLGVAFLHDNNVVHRDIKGENILVTKDGVTKVADFGCAKYMQEFSKNDDAGAAPGGFDLAGTPLWMSPEAMRGEPRVDNKPADVWSVACVGIEMLNRPIWNIREKENIYTAMFRIQKMNRLPDGFPSSDDPSTPDGQLPASFKDFLRQGLNRDPAARPTARQLLQHPFLTENLNTNKKRNSSSNFDDPIDPLEATQKVLDAMPSNFFASIK